MVSVCVDEEGIVIMETEEGRHLQLDLQTLSFNDMISLQIHTSQLVTCLHFTTSHTFTLHN